MLPVITCDLFSALVDSRAGGTAVLAALGHDWPIAADGVYDHWDAASKALQRDCTTWVPFAELSRRALRATYRSLSLEGSADDDVQVVLGSVGDWPLWPDVEDAMPRLQAVARVGVLSNVDDALLSRTRAARLVDPALLLTSERLRAYKPRPQIYRGARDLVGPFVHLASSARDVRGALEAGLAVVRLVRPGHLLDPAGPQPAHSVGSLAELPAALGDVTPR